MDALKARRTTSILLLLRDQMSAQTYILKKISTTIEGGKDIP